MNFPKSWSLSATKARVALLLICYAALLALLVSFPLLDESAPGAKSLLAAWARAALHLLPPAVVVIAAGLLFGRRLVLRKTRVMAAWIKALTGDEPVAAPEEMFGLFSPLVDEVERLARGLSTARASAEEEASLRHHAEAIWTPDRLKQFVRDKLHGRPVFVVANREPYSHERVGKELKVTTPASGLVTGVEPVLLACGGTWVAHGSGSADRETVDDRDRIQVPPSQPKYWLRRVWLSAEEQRGYYDGFANSGLWPLCHITHTRPEFKEQDWLQYRAVNRKFADALLEELEGTEEPCVLIQDYHFALLPRMIKEARPDARVAIFWHIPWPNFEAFRICPWQQEILDGMLGADLVGFHVQYHCNNFLETVDRALESRIDRDRFVVHRFGHETLVKPFPISIALPEPDLQPAPDKAALLRSLGLRARFLGVGVDRIDYTKGLLERFLAIERFLEKYPQYQGQFTFVEFGAPSRTSIEAYGNLLDKVTSEADRINERFQAPGYKAIALLAKHHGHDAIRPFYRGADLCLVTSLHDGMNLVAKEFVAARDDDSGVLILSRFTGAAQELHDALVVNPYDIEQMAEAIRTALKMGEGERRRRMSAMRKRLREQNVYGWAAKLIDDLAAVRLPQAASSPSSRTA
jgi:trehalose 6-phosphate synthase